MFKLSDAKEGVNYPVMHPRCRCTTTMNMNYSSRIARNLETGRNYKVDGDMTYSEWIKSLTPEQKKALETARKKDANKTADKLDRKLVATQYKRDITKTVDKSVGSGIIKMRGDGMYRNSGDVDIEPMPEEQLSRIERKFKMLGGTIQRSPETDAYLEMKDAEAITYNVTTILLKQHPTRASVFEELIHATQYKNGENDGSYLCRIKCEIAAQEKLLKYSTAYKLTDVEIVQTKKALKEYQKELLAYNTNGGV